MMRIVQGHGTGPGLAPFVDGCHRIRFAVGAGVSVCICLLLFSCTVGPDYAAPKIDAPERFVSQEVLAALNEGKEAEEVPADWWEGFSDPLLSRLVEGALENNLRIAAAMARLDATRAELALIDADDSVNIGAGGEAGIDEERSLNERRRGTTGRGISGVLDLIWPFDLFGRNEREVEAARAAVEASEARLRALVLDISTVTAREYLQLRGNQRRLQLLEQSVALQEKTLSIVRSRFEAGLSPELDLRRAETSVERLRARIPPLEEELLNTRNRLAVLNGMFPGAFEETLRSDSAIPGYRGRFVEAVPLSVLMRRPDIREAEAELKEATARIGVAEADYYPDFALASGISITSSAVEGSSTVDLLTGWLSVSVDQLLYDGGAREAALTAAEARARAALLQYRQALLDAVQEVEAVLAAIRSSEDRRQSLDRAVRASALSFNQAENLYQQGLISFLDVVDAQRELADAEQSLASERTRMATRIAILFGVLGGGRETPENQD